MQEEDIDIPKNIKKWVQKKDLKLPIAIILVAAILFSIVAYNYGFDGYWTAEKIETGNIRNSLLQYDSNNNPHILFQNYSVDESILTHKYMDNGVWVTEIVKSAKLFRDVSLAIDENNDLHITCKQEKKIISFNGYEYITTYENSLIYFEKINGIWSNETIESKSYDSFIPLGYWNVLSQFDEDTGIHLLYYSSEDLCYANKINDNWTIDIVDRVYPDSKSFAFDLDSNGYPHICYQNKTLRTLSYIWWNGTSWQYEDVLNDFTVRYDEPVRMALDSTDSLFIAYHNITHLKFIRLNEDSMDVVDILSPHANYRLFQDEKGNIHAQMTGYDGKNYVIQASWEDEFIHSEINIPNGYYVVDNEDTLHEIYFVRSVYSMSGILYLSIENSSETFYPFYALFIIIIGICLAYIVKAKMNNH